MINRTKKLFFSQVLLMGAVVVIVTTLASQSAFALWGAGTGSNNSQTAGAIGLAVNGRSSSQAVSAAWAKNPGISPYGWRAWSSKGYCAVARAYNRTGTRWNFGYAWGYRSSSSAISKARSYTDYYGEAWISGYNN